MTAAAVSASKNLTQLSHAGLEAARIAFQVASKAFALARVFEPSASTSSSWTISVAHISFDKASSLVDNFNSQKVSVRVISMRYLLIRSAKQVSASDLYISSVSKHAIEVNGPPKILDDFEQENALRPFGFKRQPNLAPYHSGRLFSKHDVDQILTHSSLSSLLTYQRTIDCVSCSNGKLSWTQTLRSLFEDAIISILIQPLRYDLIVDEFIAHLRSNGVSRIEILSLSIEDDLVSLAPDESDVSVSRKYYSPQDLRQPSGIHKQHTAQSKIAIVGYSGRFPNANNLESYWELLHNGRDVHKEAPKSRWDVETHVDATGKKRNTSKTPFGCWLDDAAQFDARFFHLSPREAPQIDPAQRIALMTAYEALESAGIVPDATPSTRKDRVGVFYGITSNDWMETNSAQNIDTYMIPGGNRAFIPGRFNYLFKFSGPSYSVDNACSSSLAAIHAACNSLWRCDADTAIAGGTNILTNPDFAAGLDRGHFLSRTGNCKSFDDSADGYCRGEGVCTVILKRYEDAVADNDPIHGVILSAYTNHSADAESITRPYGGAQKAILNRLLRHTATDAYEVSYIEMHGTGTQAGDAEEMRSVVEVFAPENRTPIRKNDQTIYLGSIKANIGHGEAASGVSSLAKVLLMMKHNLIPPHCGIKTKLNHKFPGHMRSHNVRIATEPTPWPRPSLGVRKVFVNNFSAAGGNSALLLEDAPVRPELQVHQDVRTHHMVAVSAKSAKSLRGNIDAMISYLSKTDIDRFSRLPALSYTSTARRMHHPL